MSQIRCTSLGECDKEKFTLQLSERITYIHSRFIDLGRRRRICPAISVRDPIRLRSFLDPLVRFAWEDPWQASLRRKIVWYIFGYVSVIVMFTLAILLYGDPITDTDGILPWKPIPDWNVASVMSFMVVSLTFTGSGNLPFFISPPFLAIFFLPLLFLPHRLDEGKTFQNDPNFLRRIGVVIPCHKSASEIGNVVNQVSIHQHSLFHTCE